MNTIYLITRCVRNPDNLDVSIQYYSTLGISPSWTVMPHVADRFTPDKMSDIVEILIELTNNPDFDSEYTTHYLTKTTTEQLS